jgi:hypothetical protein
MTELPPTSRPLPERFSGRFPSLLGPIPLRPLLVVLLAAAAGCGGRKGDVAGQVNYGGSPLLEGKVTFVCEGGDKPVLQTSIRDGRYELKGVPAGPVKVTVATYPPAVTVAPPPGMGSGKVPGREQPQPGRYVKIPERYSRIDQSDLGFIVQPGSQVHNINLEP